MSISTPENSGQWYLRLPNALTWLRILMIPAVIVIFYLPYAWKDPATCGR